MNLYEITNGFMGESYVRLYAWARDEDHARQLAVISFATHEGRYGAAYYEDLQIEKLLSGDEQPFATKPSDAGWERAAAQTGGEDHGD